MKALKLKIAGGTAALVAVLGGGAAVAATQLSPAEESDAIVADAAKQLGVSADKLDAALKQALENRVDAAVEAGTLTAAQAAELKERIAGRRGPAGRGRAGPRPPHRGHHGFVDFAAAADYLGVTEAKLRGASLEDGDTLAEIAKANGKTAAGLVNALVAAAQSRSRREGRRGPADLGASGRRSSPTSSRASTTSSTASSLRLPRRAWRTAAGPIRARPAPTPDCSLILPFPRPGRALTAGAARILSDFLGGSQPRLRRALVSDCHDDVLERNYGNAGLQEFTHSTRDRDDERRPSRRGARRGAHDRLRRRDSHGDGIPGHRHECRRRRRASSTSIARRHLQARAASVVEITVTVGRQASPLGGNGGTQQAQGSGFVYDTDGPRDHEPARRRRRQVGVGQVRGRQDVLGRRWSAPIRRPTSP